MSWLENNLATVIPLATAGTAGLAAAVRALWLQLVTAPKLECQAEKVILRAENDRLELELKAERLDHWKTAMTLERLSGKYERERGSTSSRPPSS